MRLVDDVGGRFSMRVFDFVRTLMCPHFKFACWRSSGRAECHHKEMKRGYFSAKQKTVLAQQ